MTQSTEKQNQDYFLNHLDEYSKNVHALDTYKNQRKAIDGLVAGSGLLLDVGNGGVFEYDVTLAKEIHALDLFLDGLPPSTSLPPNVKRLQGSVLDMAIPAETYDAVMMVMLLHHLTGDSAASSRANVAKAIDECFRVLKPGGKLIVIESCVPRWFYLLECIGYRPAAWFIKRTIEHPPTLQFPISTISSLVMAKGDVVSCAKIPKGRWILQFGFKFPAILTPAQPYALCARKGKSQGSS